MLYKGLIISAMSLPAVVSARGVLAKEIAAAAAERNHLMNEGKKNTPEYQKAQANLSHLKNIQASLLFRSSDFHAYPLTTNQNTQVESKAARVDLKDD